MKKISEKISFKTKSVIVISVMIALTVLLNVGLQFLPEAIKAFDITDNKSYTLSDTSKDYFSSLDEKVTLYVLDANGTDIKYEHWLDRVGSSFKNIDVKWTTYDKVSDKLTALGVKLESASPYLLLVESEKRSMVAGYSDLISYRTNNSNLISLIQKSEMTAEEYNYWLTMVAQYANSTSEQAAQYVQVLQMLVYDVEKYFNAEPYLCKLVEYVTVDIIPARYTLTGHGETELNKTEMGYMISNSLGLYHNELDISGDKKIPDDAVSILIINPTSDISAKEANKLISFLNEGKQITFFTSEANLDMPNLMSVIRAYGLDADKGAVGEAVEAKAETDKTETEIIYRQEVSVNVNTDHKATESLKGLVEKISPVVKKGNSITYNNKDGFKLTPILTTSQKAYIGENTSDLGSLSVAAVSEKTGGGTLLWFTGAESFTRTILSKDEANNTEIAMPLYSNIYVVSSSMALAPTTYESTVTVPEGKYYGERLMSVTETSYVLYAVVIIVLVVATSVVGVIFWYKRKKA